MTNQKVSFSDKVTNISLKIAEPLNKFGQIKGIQAITRGLMAAMPITMTGSVFILLYVFSSPGTMGIKDFSLLPFFAGVAGKFLIPYQMTLNFLAFWASMTIAQEYAELNDFDTKKGGMVGILSFLLLATKGVDAGAISVGYFGPTGLVVAMLSSVWMTKLYIFLDRKNIKLKLPDSVPSYVGESFGAIAPMLIVTFVCWILRTILNVDVVALIQLVMSPIQGTVEALPFYLSMSLLSTLLWFCGLHGANLTSPITTPLVGGFLAENAAAKAAGEAILPHIWIGNTLGPAGFIGFMWVVVFLLMRSRVAHLKAMGKACAVPIFFCIQEPVVFGVPLVFNAYLIVPWLLCSLANGTIAWMAFSLNLVGRGFVDPSWACPSPLALFLSTSDIRSLALIPIYFIVGYVITKPFFKVYENAELKRMAEETVTE